MEIEHVLFSSSTQKMSETCQKLAFTHPIVVLKSGLKNNWMKKLDRVNQSLNMTFWASEVPWGKSSMFSSPLRLQKFHKFLKDILKIYEINFEITAVSRLCIKFFFSRYGFKVTGLSTLTPVMI